MSARRTGLLTRSGRRVLWASGAALVAARLLGVFELHLLAAAGAALVGASALRVALPAARIELHRTVTPTRVHAGTASRVVLTARNPGPRTSPVVDVHDPVQGTAGASLLVPPLPPGGQTSRSYRLPTERRGLLLVGPMSLAVADPFGLARKVQPGAETIRLTVLPRIDPLSVRPGSTGEDPLSGGDAAKSLGPLGDDFSGLRQYAAGDDLRRIHWPATAHHDDLLVRQDEQQWQGRTTLLLDVRRGPTDEDTFERQVSAAASLAVEVHQRGELLRLLTTDGTDTGFTSGRGDLNRVLERLALVRTSSGGRLHRALRTAEETGGALVAVVAGPPQADLDAIVAARRRLSSLLVVHFPPPDGAGGRSGAGVVVRGRPGSRRVRTVVVAPGESFLAAWERSRSGDAARAWSGR